MEGLALGEAVAGELRGGRERSGDKSLNGSWLLLRLILSLPQRRQGFFIDQPLWRQFITAWLEALNLWQKTGLTGFTNDLPTWPLCRQLTTICSSLTLSSPLSLQYLVSLTILIINWHQVSSLKLAMMVICTSQKSATATNQGSLYSRSPSIPQRALYHSISPLLLPYSSRG